MNRVSLLKRIFPAFIILFALASCSSASNSYAVRTPRSSTGVSLVGLGVELDPHFLAQNVTRNDGATVDDWRNIVVRRVEMMNIQRFRVMLQPHWWEPVNDNSDPQVAEIRLRCP